MVVTNWLTMPYKPQFFDLPPLWGQSLLSCVQFAPSASKVTPTFGPKLPPGFGQSALSGMKGAVVAYISVVLGTYLLIPLLFWGALIIEHIPL